MLFPDPALLIAFYDPYFRSGEYRLSPAQIDTLHRFARKEPRKATQLSEVWPNGAGKSSVLIAGCAAWVTSQFEDAQTVVTSASGAQLDRQAMRAVKRLAENMNKYHRAELWDIQYRHLLFRPTRSVIDATKSDEEGTTEGFHTLVPGGEFCVLVDEAKSIPEDIYAGINKWTGYTRRLDITSAGEPAGCFYNNHTSGRWQSKRITYKQCPHFTEEQAQEIIATYGESHPQTRSILFSEFTSLAGSMLLTYETVNRCIRMGKEGTIPYVKSEHNRAGLDLSGGGDETVMSVWNGNKQLALETITGKNTMSTVELVMRLTDKWKLPPEARWADAGGLGKPILDMLASKGCPWIRMFNQSPPLTMAARNYGNRGTEMWVTFTKLVEDAAVILLPDTTQTNQLANRYQQQRASDDRIILEPKAVAKAHGHPSPDRADATVLANCKYKPHEEKKAVENAKPKLQLTVAELMAWWEAHIGEGQSRPALGSGVTLEDLAGRKPSEEGLN